MSYRRLTPKDRYQIEAYLHSRLGIRDIARKLGVEPSTISREIKRVPGDYSAEKAKIDAALKGERRRRGKFKIKGRLRQRVRNLLLRERSPEQINGRLKLKNKSVISAQSIYRFVLRDKKSGGKLFKKLRLLRKQHLNSMTKPWTPFPKTRTDRVPIDKRPKFIDKRMRIGDLERDTVFGKANGPLLLTIVDRTSRLVRIEPVPRKSASEIHKATMRALKRQKVYTITNDNGTEFAEHVETAKKLRVKVYFSKAYRSWERGTNENMNGLIRQYFKRKRSLANVTRKEIKQVERKLNNRPRKCLGFKTPFEVHNANTR